ncbi:hypothetical protein BJ166DRAFT_296491 [Pestalotiopsis sp. NC0098]|nr:hypothetical protein BJ166DRAFT_296491 [Pestalotiopsis sp. NC0098]
MLVCRTDSFLLFGAIVAGIWKQGKIMLRTSASTSDNQSTGAQAQQREKRDLGVWRLMSERESRQRDCCTPFAHRPVEVELGSFWCPYFAMGFVSNSPPCVCARHVNSDRMDPGLENHGPAKHAMMDACACCARRACASSSPHLRKRSALVWVQWHISSVSQEIHL